MATSIFNTFSPELQKSTNPTNQLKPTTVLDEDSIEAINQHYRHLQSNLIMMSTKASVMNRKFAVSALGFQVK